MKICVVVLVLSFVGLSISSPQYGFLDNLLGGGGRGPSGGRPSQDTPLCDVRTSYIFPEFGKNTHGLKRKILNGDIRQSVKIVKCLGLNAGWAISNTVIAKCEQDFSELKLFSMGK